MSSYDPIRRRLLGVVGGLGALTVVGGLAGVATRRRTTPSPLSSSSAPVTSAALGARSSPSTVAPTPTLTSPTTSRPPSATTTTIQARDLEVICRDAWGAAPGADGMRPHEIVRMTLHHTAVRLNANTDAPARARSHQAFHQREGFADLAYHFMVDAHGNILEGRSTDYAGDTFTDYDPAGHLLVCCEGDFNTQDPTANQLAAVGDLFAWGAVTFGVSPATIDGHRSYAASSCPGDRLFAHIRDLKTVVHEGTLTGVNRIDLCGSQGRERVAAIASGDA